MRVVKLEEWGKRARPRPPMKKGVRRKPSTEEALLNSINYIRMQREYLEKEGILVRTGKRTWRLDLKKNRKIP